MDLTVINGMDFSAKRQFLFCLNLSLKNIYIKLVDQLTIVLKRNNGIA